MDRTHLNKTVLGIDIGTSGIRATIVKRCVQTGVDNILISQSVDLETPKREMESGASTQNPLLWISAINQLFTLLQRNFDLSQVTQLILDATSSTVLLCDTSGNPLTTALMYNDQQAAKHADKIKGAAGFNPNSGANGTSSTLAKVLFLIDELSKTKTKNTHVVISHQIDFINYYLCKSMNITDENNALKLGYDSVNQRWPNWVIDTIQNLQPSALKIKLPTVVRPGTKLGVIDSVLVKTYGFSPKLSVHAGTTDSIAGFLAAGACKLGDAVSSLGSTLAVKLISDKPIFNAKYGIYSHKLRNNWLIGGASNAGGAILLEAYSLPEISTLINSIQNNESLIQYAQSISKQFYPLSRPGERFPIADSNLQPKMPTKPLEPLFDPSSGEVNSAHQRYFISLIQGLTDIEKLAYEILSQMSSTDVKHLYAVGGGVKNRLWMQLRKIAFSDQIEIKEPLALDASYGVTKLIE